MKFILILTAPTEITRLVSEIRGASEVVLVNARLDNLPDLYKKSIARIALAADALEKLAQPAPAALKAAQPVEPAAVEIGELVRYAGEIFKVVCKGDTPGTFDLHVFPQNRAGDQWRNVPEAALLAQPAPAAPYQVTDEDVNAAFLEFARCVGINDYENLRAALEAYEARKATIAQPVPPAAPGLGFYEDVYDQCCEAIKPLVGAGRLPSSVVDSIGILVAAFNTAQPSTTTNLLTLLGEYADRGSSDDDGDFRYNLPAELRIAYKAHLAALPL